ncbi:FAD-dependent oxidoreductase [Variovorax soli]|uniref:FAD-dependent oxidoreductase n=1 Tax=Variovorax soli TaxID=376815 RepID=UPI0008396895|nr:NAD(P)/FAD-dependent oxidoreductase [Variovorax soli]
MSLRTAEIAGGGIGGLATAALLARDGWRVRVHERGEQIREIGAGIYIKNNSIEVLERLGVFERLKPHGLQLHKAEIRFADGSLRQQRTLAGLSRVHVFARQTLIEGLRDAALAAGAEIITNSTVTEAVNGRAIRTADGRTHEADLIVAADGVGSAVRNSLPMRSSFRILPTIIDRFLIEGREFTPEDKTVEHWSGNRRIGVTPAGPNQTYVYMVAPERDAIARQLPLDVRDWSERFPKLAGLMAALGRAPSTQFNYGVVDCEKWAMGRVAILGDAAHGLPPTLGQGAGLTLINAYALAHFLRQTQDVPAAVAQWEQRVRFISDRTQAWACRYDWFTRQWPTRLDAMRPLITWAFGRIRYLNESMRIADQGLRLAGIDMQRG